MDFDAVPMRKEFGDELVFPPVFRGDDCQVRQVDRVVDIRSYELLVFGPITQQVFVGALQRNRIEAFDRDGTLKYVLERLASVEGV